MRSLIHVAFFLALCVGIATAQTEPFITTFISIPTECKKCPYSVCANKLAYDGSEGNFSVTCYTLGDPIVSDDTWLKTEDGCYVTQYDLNEYDGDYLEVLEFCGNESQVKTITTQLARTKYKSECRFSPDSIGDNVAYLRENTDLTLTCWTDEDTLVILDDPLWFKTTNNCYVSQTGLSAKPDKSKLENCGPIPHIEYVDHNPPPGSDDESANNTQRRSAAPAPAAQAPSYLWIDQVGEEYSYCRTCSNVTCPSTRRYQFNQTVTFQCLASSSDLSADFWAQTTDFCYVNMTEYWNEEIPYRAPRCELFEDGNNGPSDPEE